jgi:hypothetical protein
MNKQIKEQQFTFQALSQDYYEWLSIVALNRGNGSASNTLMVVLIIIILASC